MNRSELLKAAEEIITKDRHNTYGSAEDNFACIASFWTMYLGRVITPCEVAHMMTLLKIARLRNNPTHADSAVDAAGYIAIACELAIKNTMPIYEESPTKSFNIVLVELLAMLKEQNDRQSG